MKAENVVWELSNPYATCPPHLLRRPLLSLAFLLELVGWIPGVTKDGFCFREFDILCSFCIDSRANHFRYDQYVGHYVAFYRLLRRLVEVGVFIHVWSCLAPWASARWKPYLRELLFEATSLGRESRLLPAVLIKRWWWNWRLTTRLMKYFAQFLFHFPFLSRFSFWFFIFSFFFGCRVLDRG